MPLSTSKKYVNNPYPGIRSFNLDESHLFFGREKQIDDISNIIRTTHFSAISGASGSGKSSIVKAGIIPKFLKEYDNLEYIIFRPGNNPIKNLSEELTSYYVKAGLDRKDVKKHVSDLYRNPKAFEQIILTFEKNKRFLIYIDQFEEIFRYRDNEQLSNSEKSSEIFIQNIVNATKSRAIEVFVIISLRSDFLSDCTVFEDLPELINKGHYLLPQLTNLQKEDAIRKPAESMGAVLSDDFIELLRDHVKDESISFSVPTILG